MSFYFAEMRHLFASYNALKVQVITFLILETNYFIQIIPKLEAFALLILN